MYSKGPVRHARQSNGYSTMRDTCCVVGLVSFFAARCGKDHSTLCTVSVARSRDLEMI